MAPFSLAGQTFAAFAGGDRTSGHYRQVFVDDARMLATHQSDHRTLIISFTSSCTSQIVLVQVSKVLIMCITGYNNNKVHSGK